MRVASAASSSRAHVEGMEPACTESGHFRATKVGGPCLDLSLIPPSPFSDFLSPPAASVNTSKAEAGACRDLWTSGNPNCDRYTIASQKRSCLRNA